MMVAGVPDPFGLHVIKPMALIMKQPTKLCNLVLLIILMHIESIFYITGNMWGDVFFFRVSLLSECFFPYLLLVHCFC